MKIGIITWFTGPNYGTNLQAIALQYYLRKQGYAVSLINYEPTTIETEAKKDPLVNRIIRKAKRCYFNVALLKYRNSIIERDRKLAEDIKSKCDLTTRINDIDKLIDVCNSFDLLICGSDQIWNPNWYNKFYYADYDAITTRRISYAPSLGVNAIPERTIPKIERSLSKFDYISVREEKAAEILKPYTNRVLKVVVDPTFLLSMEDWNSLFPKIGGENEPYVLSLFLEDERAHLKAAKTFAELHNLKWIVIPYKDMTYFQDADIRADAGLKDLLALIQGAKFIITDSFHITVFSIIYRKQFCTFQRFKENAFTSQNSRVTNLLDMMGLQDRMIPYKSTKIGEMESIHYKEHIDKLDCEIENSKLFLKNAIENGTSN